MGRGVFFILLGAKNIERVDSTYGNDRVRNQGVSAVIVFSVRGKKSLCLSVRWMLVRNDAN